MNKPEPKILPLATCKHLRCKEMYYDAHGQQDEGAFPQVYWCQKTFENFGPDKGEVDSEECCTDRKCFER